MGFDNACARIKKHGHVLQGVLFEEVFGVDVEEGEVEAEELYCNWKKPEPPVEDAGELAAGSSRGRLDLNPAVRNGMQLYFSQDGSGKGSLIQNMCARYCAKGGQVCVCFRVERQELVAPDYEMRILADLIFVLSHLISTGF